LKLSCAAKLANATTGHKLFGPDTLLLSELSLPTSLPSAAVDGSPAVADSRLAKLLAEAAVRVVRLGLLLFGE
jgi:hypothetical protein